MPYHRQKRWRPNNLCRPNLPSRRRPSPNRSRNQPPMMSPPHKNNSRAILKRSLASLAFLFALAGVAFGQAAVLQAGPWATGRVPMYAGQNGTQPIIIDSGPAGGGGAGVGLAELGITAQGSGTAPFAGQGTGPYGTNVCDYDAPITNPAGYHFFCFSANAQGGPLLAVGSGGGAADLPLSIIVNGAVVPFPGYGAITIDQTAITGGAAGTVLCDSPNVAATVGECAVSGTGSVALVGGPTFIAPVLGSATATSINKVAITQPVSLATLTLGSGKVATISNTLTFSGNDGASVNIGAGGTLGALAYGGSLLVGTNGGTGVNNGAFTITLAGNLITSGSFNTTLTATNTTNSILPAGTHTLAGLDVAQAWTAVQTFTNSDIRLLGSSTGYSTITSANAGVSNYTLTLPAVTDTVATIGTTQTWTAAQTFTNSDILLLGSSTGATTLSSANAGASNYTATLPANTGTIAELNLAQSWTAIQTFGNTTPPRLTPGTLANAGTCNSGAEGTIAAITDSASATWGDTITGTSTNHVLGYCDGTNWTVAGK